MIINLKDLPPEIYQKIPLSLRLNSDTYDFNSLPIDIQFIIRNSFTPKNYSSQISNNKVYDFSPKMTIYNDLKGFETTKELIIEYVKNYLLIDQGSYPFDPIFGTNLKKYLQTKDTELQRVFISNELDNIIRNINSYFNSNVELVDSSIIPKAMVDGSINMYLNIKIKINDEVVNLGISK
jgi:hypothetical protein